MTTDSHIITLAQRIENLLKSREQLRVENHLLRQKLTKITQERADLMERNRKAATKVKQIIAQLKDEVL